MTAKRLTGKEVSAKLIDDLSKRSEALKGKGITPCLAIVRIGENPSDLSYERGALSKAEKTGVDVKKYVLSEDVTTEDVVDVIEEINSDDSIHGVLLFRPMPAHIDDSKVRESLAPEKDMDGITDGSLAGVFSGKDIGYPPCTASACMDILDYYNIDPSGKKAVVIGRSLVIGRPAAMMLMKKNATVTICHTKTGREDLTGYCKDADIIVAAAGSAGNVTAELLREGQVVLDVGINVGEDGKMCGDVVEADAVAKGVSFTPVPGGVGGVTSTILMKHVIEAAEKIR